MALYDEALAVAHEVGATMSVALAMNGQAVAHRRAGRLDEAVTAATEARSAYRTAEAPLSEAQALATLGFVAECTDELDDARRLHLEGLALVQDLGDGRAVALALEGLAGVHAAEGSGERAAELLGHASRLRVAAGGAPAGPTSDLDRVTARTRALLEDATFDEAHERGGSASTKDLVESVGSSHQRSST